MLQEGSEALIQEELPSSCLSPSMTVSSPGLLPPTRSSNLEGTLGVPGLAGNPHNPLPHFSWKLPSLSSCCPSCLQHHPHSQPLPGKHVLIGKGLAWASLPAGSPCPPL